jgi:hypothetical protein
MCVHSVQTENTSIRDPIICNGKRSAHEPHFECKLTENAIVDMYGSITSTKSATTPNSATSSPNDPKAEVAGGGDG